MKRYIFILFACVVFVLAFVHLCGKADDTAQMHDDRVCETEENAVRVTRATTAAPVVEPETVEVIATAYCSCEKCCGVWALNRPNGIVYTASGAEAKANHTIAVDPAVFPFGTVLVIGGIEYVAEDTGSAIVGNKIDIYFDDHGEAWKFGRQELTATIKD